ncbi:Hint domain-containing protein [Reinekea blandensis]|uniref:Hint domain-containing protein n=1 Tax=Reinekea blandensis MED297 TaxID=314283 RepID=A4BAV3_9GAMM|nr:Hint domain-containing protein [Reinekea blandensis]EAR10566.1 hypothetical protein MED297_11140 [Reinekea sp. MED297] [Reinekea blandensis MED297]
MNKKTLALAITSAALGSALTLTSTALAGDSSVSVKPSMGDREATYKHIAQRGQNGFLNPANNEDFAIIMEHLRYAGVTPAEAPMHFKMVEEARRQALMNPQLFTEASLLVQDPTLHHSVHMPKTVTHPATLENRLIAAATVNVADNLVYGYTTTVLKDPNGVQIGKPGAKRAYAGEADRSIALTDVDTDYIAANYDPDDQFILESFAMTQDTDGQRQFHTSRNVILAKALMSRSSSNGDNGTLTVEAPVVKPAHAGNNNIKICLNRDHGDCDYPQMYPSNTPNSQLKVRLPIAGSIETIHEIIKVYAPGETGQGVIQGLDTGVWIMAGDPNADGEWAHMRHPDDPSTTFVDYVNFRPFLDEFGNVTTVLTWDVPMEDALFGVGADNTQATLFKRFENVQWEIRLRVQAQDTIDMDGDLSTTDDRIVIVPPYDTVFVAENASLDDELDQWVLEEKLPFLYFEYSCVAKGSLIAMADGSVKAIEDVMIGDVVLSDGKAMQVTDTSIGYEAEPMIAITDDLGHNVLLTRTHPVQTSNRGVIWAEEVQAGDQLMTQQGSSTVTAVEEQLFNDTVHNLELEPASGTNETDELMFANGIAIGDLGYQSSLTFKDKAPSTVEATLEQLPEAWHQDYLNSLK